jgi:hypothetical protein
MHTGTVPIHVAPGGGRVGKHPGNATLAPPLGHQISGVARGDPHPSPLTFERCGGVSPGGRAPHPPRANVGPYFEGKLSNFRPKSPAAAPKF